MRYERKYRNEHLDHSEVLQMVRSHPMSFRRQFPDRQVNNVYFDTPELHFLHENLLSVDERRKYRIRWYGDDILQAKTPILEMKCKNGDLGDKSTVAMPDLSLGDSGQMEAAFAASFESLHATRTLETGLAGQDLIPVLLNTYIRSYFISYDGKYRLTMDRDIHHYGFNARQLPQPFPQIDAAIVLEIKYEEADADGYERIGQRIPLRVARNSKYTSGMLMVGNV